MPAKKRTKPKAGSKYKGFIKLTMMDLFGVDKVKTEYRFHPDRLWRFDYAVPHLKLAVEYQGHGSTGKSGHIGGHASVKGMSNDCEKLNNAQLHGWTVLKFTAFHFDPKKRISLKLTAPSKMIEQARNYLQRD